MVTGSVAPAAIVPCGAIPKALASAVETVYITAPPAGVVTKGPNVCAPSSEQNSESAWSTTSIFGNTSTVTISGSAAHILQSSFTALIVYVTVSVQLVVFVSVCAIVKLVPAAKVVAAISISPVTLAFGVAVTV